MSLHVTLEAGEGTRVADTGAGIVGEQRPDDVVRPAGVPGRGQQNGASVQVEPPGRARAETGRRQHRGQRGRGVVRVVPVPERVPLAAAQDGAQGVILQQQHSAGREPGRALGQGLVLVGGVHQAGAVDDHVGFLAVVRRPQPAAGQQSQPRPAVGAAILGDQASRGQQPGPGDSLHGVGGLRDERSRLGASGLLGNGGIGQQLGQAAR